MPTVPVVNQRQNIASPAAPALGNPNAMPEGALDRGGRMKMAGEDLKQTSDAFSARFQEVTSRQDALTRAREFSMFRNNAQQLFLQERTGGSDFGNPKNVSQFSQDLRQQADDLIANHVGSADSRARLAEAINSEYTKLMDAGHIRGIETTRKNVLQSVGADIAIESALAGEDPTTIADRFKSIEARIEGFYGPSLDPSEVEEQVKVARSEITKSAIESFLGKPLGVTKAAELLLDPIVQKSLPPSEFRALRKRVLEAEAEVKNARAIGMAERQRLSAFLGVPVDELTDEQLLLSKHIQRPPTDKSKLVRVGDDTSPTGSRFVPEEEAAGMPGPPSTPMVTVDNKQEGAFAAEMGKLEANEIEGLRTNARIAQSNKNEFARIRAAMDSGRFPTGTFAGQRVFVSRLATFLGMDQDSELMQMIGDAKIADTIDAAVAKIATNIAQEGGRNTNLFLTLIKDSLMSLSRTEEGNKILIEAMSRAGDREIELARVAESYAREFNTLNPTQKQWEAQMPGIPYRSYLDATIAIEEADPVINQELIDRIQGAVKDDPGSTQKMIDNALPAGVPRGSEYIGDTESGGRWYRAPNGDEYIVEENR
jgi:hypothetical protein